RVVELEESLTALAAEEAAGAARVEGVRSARRRLEERSDAVAALRRDLEGHAAQHEARRAELARRLTEDRDRLAPHASERGDAEAAMAAECPELPAGTSPPNRVRELERELRLMGPINPLALEEYEQLQERHTFLEGQLDDIKSSRRELAKVIKAVDREIVDVF